MEKQYIHGYNALGTRRNHDTQRTQYLEFCDFSRIRPFPVTEFKICKYATFLSTKMKTVESIKGYCATICNESELRGYKTVRRGLKYYRCISGIRQSLRHSQKSRTYDTRVIRKNI